MTTKCSLPFFPQACSSSNSINPHESHGGFFAPRLLRYPTAFSSVLNVGHKGQASVVGNFLFALPQAAGGKERDFRVPVLHCMQISNSDNSLGLHSASGLVSEGFYDIESLDSQVNLKPIDRHDGSAAPSSGTVRERKEEFRDWESGLWSVVIPTYNRLPILTKCLQALEEQRDYSAAGIDSYEVIVVDDGSTDGTVEFLRNGNKFTATCEDDEIPRLKRLNREAGYTDRDTQIGSRGKDFKEPFCEKHVDRFPHVKLVEQKHGGATTARNLGLKYAKGAIIVFIDSDLIVTENFLKAHGEALRDAFLEDGDDRAFTYGRVVNTSNFHDPKSEKVKLTDYSAAFFATGNVAISHRRLLEAGKLLGCNADGPFDAEFSEYGWEDLELGVRLKQCGARIKHAPAAVGYHWHPAFSIEQLPKLIDQERQRGRNGVHFYRKHPTFNVRLMVQLTPFHEVLWFLLTLGGSLNERTIEPILRRLVLAGKHRAAAALISPILNWHTVQAAKEESRKLNVR